jgi:membrane protease YdiL (CAAX protease family)
VRSELKSAIKRFGLGIVNLTIAIALYIAVAVIAHGHLSNFVLTIIGAVIMAAAYIGGGRLIEAQRLTEFAGGGSTREFAVGLGLGFCLFSAVMVLLWPVSVYHPVGWGIAAGLGGGAVAALSEAVVEEVLFRGFLFRLIEVAAGTWSALFATSVLFGAAHAFNPGATVLSSIAIALEAGVLLGAAYAVTGRLWFPIGLHAAWNFTETNVFGMSVSGLGATKGLIIGTLRGPTILTGGGFGPEASIVAVLVCVSAALLILWRVVRLGRVQPPSWSRITGPQVHS